MRILPLSDFPERFTSPGPRWLRLRGEPPRPVELIAGRQLHGKNLFVVRLAGIESRQAAEALVGAHLLVDGNDRPSLAEGEFHLLDLLGLAVHRLKSDGSRESEPIGRVADLIHAGNDLLEVERLEASPSTHPSDPGIPSARQPARLLIPFVEAIVPVVNLEEGWIGITPPQGLLDL
jgi:16S rRNA processing protein RimM